MAFESEEEQLEAIKRWLQKNGLPVVLGIVVVVAATFGWRAWQSHQFEQSAQASVVYQRMMAGLQQSAVNAKDVEAMKVVQTASDKLIKNWPDSAYADYAHLALAKQAVMRADYKQAIDQLQQTTAKPANDALKHVASLRLARLYIETGELDKALDLVTGSYPEAWQGQALELKGDILFQQKKPDEARQAYESAKSAYQGSANTSNRLDMKINRLKAAS